MLVVSATADEVMGITKSRVPLGLPTSVNLGISPAVDFLVTGVGAVPTAFRLAQYAPLYDFVLNVGIAGSFIASLPIADVVAVQRDVFGDYGIDNNGTFVPLVEAGFTMHEAFSSDFLVNPYIGDYNPAGLRVVNGVTMSTASGSAHAIAKIITQWNPDIETMEGAAVFYSCLALGKPFLCIRAISNMVEPRNRSAWRIGDALKSLSHETINILSNL